MSAIDNAKEKAHSFIALQRLCSTQWDINRKVLLTSTLIPAGVAIVANQYVLSRLISDYVVVKFKKIKYHYY